MYGLSLQYLGDGLLDGLLPQNKSGNLSGQLRARLDVMFKPDETWEPTDTIKIKATDYRDYDLALAAGLEARLGERFSAAPYLGLGFLHNTMKVSTTVTDYEVYPSYYLHYQEYNAKDKVENTLFYLPIGADWKWSLPRDWKLTLNTELDVFLYLKYKNSRSRHDIDYYVNYLYPNSSYSEISDEKEKSSYTKSLDFYRFNLAFKAEKNFGKVGVFVEPFYRGYSDTEYLTGSGEYGLRAGITV
jgi:hypothetical protein